MNNFPSDRPLVPPVSYPSDRPPIVPQQVVTHPSVQQYTLFVCSAIATLAGATSAQNPARMFSYNAISSNNWFNPIYTEMVQLGVDYLGLSFSKGLVVGDVAGFIRNLASTLVGYKAGQFASQFPGLLNGAPDFSRAKGEADSFAQAYYAMQNEALQWRNQNGSGGYGMAPQNNLHMGPSYQGHSPAPAMLPNIAHHAATRASSPAHTGIHIGSIASGPPVSPHVDTSPSTGGVFSRSELVNRNHQLQQAQAYAQTQGAPMAPVVQAPAPEPELEWVSSELQRHPPLINTAVEDAELVVTNLGDGQTAVSYQITVLDEDTQMDRAAHVIHPTARPLTRYTPESGSRTDGVANALTAIAEDISKPKEAISVVRGYVPDLVVNTYSLDQAIRAVRYYHKAYLGAESQATAFRVDAGFTECFYAIADHTFEIQEIAKTGNLLAVAKKISGYLNAKSETYELKSIMYQLDRLLTQRINSVLWNNMGVTAATLDSFCTDMPALLDLLKNHANYGDLYINALNKHTEEFLENWMSFESADETDFAPVPAIAATHTPIATPVPHRLEYVIAITNLELLFDELNIKFTESDVACEIHKSSLPALWDFVHTTMSTHDADLERPARYFLTTLDGYVLELHRGFLDAQTYLMSIHRS